MSGVRLAKPWSSPIGLLFRCACVGVCVILMGGCVRTPVPAPSQDVDRQALVMTITDLRGTLKPCGCSPDLERGGVDRIAHRVQEIRKNHPNSLLFHAGNLFVDDEGVPPSRRAQTDRRLRALGDSMRWIGVTATTLGEYDLAQGLAWLKTAVSTMPTPIVATNVSGHDWDTIARKTLLVETQGIRVGVVGIVPPGEGVVDPLPALRQASRSLRDQGADIVVALSAIGLRQAKRLLRKDPMIDLLVAGGLGLKAPVSSEVERFGTAWLVQSHIQGSHVGQITLTFEAKSRDPLTHQQTNKGDHGRHFKYELSPVGWDLPSHPQVLGIMQAYNRDLASINLRVAGTLPPLNKGQASYVGADACLECHEEVQPFWDADKHHKAWDTLVEEGKTFDLECVSCHTTGYGQPGGSILGALKNLKTVQCESCHGPGSIHVEDEEADSIQLVVPQSVCVTCHNAKHSTGFQYDSYRSKLMVPGHGK
jgi:2',3'-cyclic-nucleotide 2'-phosphodiesterase (5'-nucleotidase family)